MGGKRGPCFVRHFCRQNCASAENVYSRMQFQDILGAPLPRALAFAVGCALLIEAEPYVVFLPTFDSCPSCFFSVFCCRVCIELAGRRLQLWTLVVLKAPSGSLICWRGARRAIYEAMKSLNQKLTAAAAHRLFPPQTPKPISEKRCSKRGLRRVKYSNRF